MAEVIRIGSDNRPEADTVTLFGKKFTIRRFTRSVQKALEKIEKEVGALGDDPDADKLVSAVAGGIDVLLVSANGSTTTAKTVLVKAWKDDELSYPELMDLSTQLQENAARRPPTSPAGT